MGGDSGRITVLCVDDEPDFVDLTATCLERRDDDFDVSTATDAAAGLDRLSEEDVDCVVSDYEMPGRNGVEFLRAVRERHPDLPFVLFTGKGSEEVASEAISAGATDYLQKDGGTEQYELLANRVRNAVEQYRATCRAANLDRIRTLASDVTQALVRADSRDEAEASVCEILSASDPYLFAWIGGVDPETDRIEPRVSAGIGEGYLAEMTVTIDETPTGRGPGGTAIRERRVAVSQNVHEDPTFEPWEEAATEHGFRAVAAVPLEHGDELYGELAVYADRPGAFDADERALLAELGDDIGHALHSFEVQDRLREERDRRQALFANAPGPIVTGTISDDGSQFRLRDVNAAFEDVFGYDAEAVVGRDIADVVVPADGSERHETLRERTAAGKSTVAEVERVTASGVRTFLSQIIPYGTGGDGIDGFYGWYTDITEREERERAVEELHATSQTLTRAETREAVAETVVEAASEVLGLSVNAVHLYDEAAGGLAPVAWTDGVEEVIGDPPTFEPGDSLAWEAFETGECRTYDDVSTVDGRYSPTTPIRSDLILPLGDHGVALAGSTVPEAFDETAVSLARTLATHARIALDRIEYERQLQRQNERLSEFASIVSHDLRNPLNVANGRLELARAECDGEHLDAVARAHERMETLITDLLTLAREGEAATAPERVALTAVVEDCWERVESGESTLHVDADSVVRADPGQLRQLLENLLTNATEHGGESATVTVGDSDDGFYVADDGPGVPPEDRDRVFESGYTTVDDGTGLGLNIVERVASAHGWTVGVTESESGGARFEVVTGSDDGD